MVHFIIIIKQIRNICFKEIFFLDRFFRRERKIYVANVAMDIPSIAYHKEHLTIKATSVLGEVKTILKRL